MKLQILFIISFILLSCGQRKDTNSNATIDSVQLETIKTDNIPISSENQNCLGDNNVSNLGIGLVIASDELKIYNDSLLSDNFQIISTDNIETMKIKICPKYFYPEYNILHFVCLGHFGKAYKVLINFSDTKYLPDTYKLMTWNEYILSSFGIRRSINDECNIIHNQPLRINPDENSDTLAIPAGHELFCPMELKDDWLKVTYDCFYNSSDNPHEGEPCNDYIAECDKPLIGWIKWRSENKVLIDIFLIP